MHEAHDFVRPATPLDAASLGAIHAASMRWGLTHALGGELPSDAVSQILPEEFARAWKHAIMSPPDPRAAVLVAVTDGAVAGFTAVYPLETTDVPPTAEITAFEVEPGHTRAGHGSRLLAAASDTAAELGAAGLTVWILAGDDARTQFFASAGFAPAGIRRILNVAGHNVVEHGWHAVLH
ncbi:MAG: GNAT family N-acetyltransferase [Ancrocorticia sp.]|jgi:GNAT superfamily N-acetyltransferase|nr:GNAT family N-acetyltransferase [Ancrocorticia sp.]MCI1895367.1 GNAT family N-acetyltransferase [Ancrocorticia sp.]MCI1932026.1 GNAT family N-acetyltransferase [Ancrocorticia sp.]MCI1963387.1 GNAT family N-acetyltransferase [Ancrocorticia sp.]MCI2002419.1 GNAT family N-acetyltransferase [Ancrocorticia sp.]